MSSNKFEITDISKCVIGVRLSKDDELGRNYNATIGIGDNHIQIYISDPYVGLDVNLTTEEAKKVRDKLDALIKSLED